MWDSDNETPYGLQCPRKSFDRCDSDQEVDKENHSPAKTHDESLYGPNSPSHIVLSCNNTNHRQVNRLRSLDEHDPSSQDSGYAASYQEEVVKFHSFESLEDDFLEDFSDIESLEKGSTLPVDFNKLVNNTIKNRQCKENKLDSPCDSTLRPMFRRALSLQNASCTTPTNTKVRTNLFNKSTTPVRPFKRPDPPTTCENSIIKRSKLYLTSSPASKSSRRSPVKRSQSATEESIMHALQRSTTEPDLIGDYSKNFCLPLTKGKHQDLKAISAETLVKLVSGEYNDTVESFKVVDCRYPYEFEGGHIKGAINIYTRTQCQELLQQHLVPTNDSNKRHILVFHCEFSSERGPNLCRYLRQEDRHKHEDVYPLLHYPELYVLEGGYKKFFQMYSELCVPIAYKQMLDPNHEEDLKHFRQKSKTWNADTKRRGKH